MPVDDPHKPIGIVYAEEREDGSFVFGVGPEDFELMRQGYGCMNCLEKFVVNGTLVYFPVCPFCKADVTPIVAPTPDHWLSYMKHKQEVLEKPSGEA